ncbi:MAG: hypothetical protein ACOC44_10855 [Promethearchaeia archaeon]
MGLLCNRGVQKGIESVLVDKLLRKGIDALERRRETSKSPI